MNIRPFISLVFLLAASFSVFIATGAAASAFDRDEDAHRACLERLQTVAREQRLPLNVQPTFEAQQPAAGQYHYFMNARVRGTASRHYRVECEAWQTGRVTYFALEPGRWIYAEPDTDGIAAR